MRESRVQYFPHCPVPLLAEVSVEFMDGLGWYLLWVDNGSEPENMIAAGFKNKSHGRQWTRENHPGYTLTNSNPKQ